MRPNKRNRREQETGGNRYFQGGKTMTTIETFIRKFDTRFLCLTLLGTAIASAPLIGADVPATQEATQQTGQTHAAHAAKPVPAKLVQLVRESTGQFINVNAATAAGYQPFLGCV